MLPYRTTGNGTTSLLLLHFFGGSGLQWTEVAAALGGNHRCIAADLPGFGAANDLEGYSVEEMANQVCDLIEYLSLDNLFLIGHSMSGKVSLAVSKRMPEALAGLILVAPSPPSPEPIPDESRKKMLALLRDPEDGEKYIDGNSAVRLPSVVRDRSIQDFVRASPEAWTAWLASGSKDDWAERIGVIPLPALVVAGRLDKTLGPEVQERLTLPHLRDGRLEVMPDSGHLIPMECPIELAETIGGFVDDTVG